MGIEVPPDSGGGWLVGGWDPKKEAGHMSVVLCSVSRHELLHAGPVTIPNHTEDLPLTQPSRTTHCLALSVPVTAPRTNEGVAAAAIWNSLKTVIIRHDHRVQKWVRDGQGVEGGGIGSHY